MAVIAGIAALAGVGGATNPYGTSSTGQWNLARGVFTRTDNRAMTFFFESASGENRHQRTAIDQMQDQGGRRIAVYEYPYKDGQRARDLGRKGETFTFTLKFFGLDYQVKFREFIDVVANSGLGGTLVHPVRGALKVRFRDWEFIHRFDEWNAVTIRTTWVDDSFDALTTTATAPTIDGSLRGGLQVLADVQTKLTQAIGDANLINVARSTLKNRLQSVVAQVGQLIGNLTATFSSNAKLQSLAAQGAATVGGITELSSGTVTTGAGAASQLPPVFQTGFDQQTQTVVEAQTANFLQASQVTTQQAVFQANQARQGIGAAITEAENLLGVDAYDITLAYRTLAVSVQTTTEVAISTAQSLVKLFVTPRTMSLRQVCTLNGLDYNRQGDLANLNPYLGSVNYVPAGTTLTIPAA